MLACLVPLAAIVLLHGEPSRSGTPAEPAWNSSGTPSPLGTPTLLIGKSHAAALASPVPFGASTIKTFLDPATGATYTPTPGVRDVVVWQTPLPSEPGSWPSNLNLYVSRNVVVPDFAGMTVDAGLRLAGERGLALQDAATGLALSSPNSSMIASNQNSGLIGNLTNVGSTIGVILVAVPPSIPTSCVTPVILGITAGLAAGYLLTKLKLSKRTMPA